MWNVLPAQTPLYRASRVTDTWQEVLLGLGSFYSSGGRYNTTHQPTIYTSEDPLAALAEFGWHAALKRCEDLGNEVAPSYPVSALGKLWRFEFTTPIPLVDITHPTCVHHFGYPAYTAGNPHPDRYQLCQRVANRLRAWAHPPAPHTRPEGLIAPSLRTPGSTGYAARQIVLFAMPAPVVPKTLQDRGTLLDSWDVELEFLNAHTREPTTAVDPVVAWLSPRYKLLGGTGPVPKFPDRPRSKAIGTNTWHTEHSVFPALT